MPNPDPNNFFGFFVLFAWFVVTAILMWLTHAVKTCFENRVPAFRRELEAAYTRFHKLLLAVRCAALRSI
jgi:hypothetical protein